MVYPVISIYAHICRFSVQSGRCFAKSPKGVHHQLERNGGRGTTSVQKVRIPPPEQESPETIQAVLETALGNLEEKFSEIVEAKVSRVFAGRQKYSRPAQRRKQPRNDQWYQCGMTGHFKRDCPHGRSQIICYRCEKRRHKVSECPELPPHLGPKA